MYESPKDDIVNDFFIPVLRESKEYWRATGFFSSSALLEISVGLKDFVKNGGHINLICSPRLSEDDIEAIKKGYQNKEIVEQISNEALLRGFTEPKDYFEKERYNILSHLISSGILDIRIALTLTQNDMAMFHDKLGVIKDSHGNMISFTGSMNSSSNAYKYNHEQISVFSNIGADYQRTIQMKETFERYWNNKDRSLEVIPFPDDLKKRIDSYKKKKVDWNIDKKEFGFFVNERQRPFIPDSIKTRSYQNEAREKWQENSFKGIYDMATGTGKTITAITSLIDLLEYKSYYIAIIICVPYQHLVTQWGEDLKKFNIQYIAGYSDNKRNWKHDLEKQIFDLNHDIRDYICLITTNASYRTTFIQNIINGINKDIVLVVDEAHNFGSKTLKRTLDDRFKYRLALSATLERKYDEEGTNTLYDYFGPKCIEYTLKEAIDQEMLTPYKYYPLKVYLDQDELEQYMDLTYEISKALKKDKNGKIIITEQAKRLLIIRSRKVAGARNKIKVLKEVIKPYIHDNHMLIYCGATTVNKSEDEFNSPNKEELRQIEEVEEILSEDFDMCFQQYTSQENSEEREQIRKDFDDGSVIQALVAIRCLDEGVNIPSIDKAFILASSTNPKEYIQRRGRVLRKYPNKECALIFDFVTLPRDLNNINPMDDLDGDISLLRRELRRVKDFSELALNNYESMKFIDEIEDVYGSIDLNKENEIYE